MLHREQASSWPENPLHKIINWVKERHSSAIIADMGCGDAELSASVRNEVFSFDMVAVNDRVTACDMAHVPLKDESVDIIVFCLSLMGINIGLIVFFLLEWCSKFMTINSITCTLQATSSGRLIGY